jgi:hypothetical protein
MKEFGEGMAKTKDDLITSLHSETKAAYKVRHEALKERVAKENNPDLDQVPRKQCPWSQVSSSGATSHRVQIQP